MKTIQINYFVPGVLLFLFLTLFVFGVFMPLLMHCIKINNKPGIYFIIGWWVLFLYPSTIAIKSFIKMLLGKPAIILTEAHYIDNITGVSVLWLEIKNISTYHGSNLIVAVANNSLVYELVDLSLSSDIIS